MNVQININKAVYPKSAFRVAYTGFSSTITKEGISTKLMTGLHRNGVLVDEIDAAFKRLIDSMVGCEETGAVITVSLPEGYTLSAALQQHYADKYTLEPEIDTITFA